jgi:methyl-accepting chemotaxis protein
VTASTGKVGESASDVASAAEELTGQAASLRQQVEQFLRDIRAGV